MLHTWRLRLLALATLALGAHLLASYVEAGGDGFVAVFNGKDLTGIKSIPPDPDGKTYKVQDGVLIVTGKPNGYFYTEKSFKNYVLAFDWRFKRPEKLEDEEKFGGNSGLLIHIQGDHKIWPKCLEVQGMNREHGKLLALGVKGTDFKFDAKALKEARKKVGEWNTTEVTCVEGDVVVKVNGAQVASGKSELSEGPLGWQSEGSEIHFKNIKVKAIK